MRLNERHLLLLAAVLDSGSVSEGAAMTGQTQPAVSRALSMLEARVGEPLFVKGRRPLQATPLGLQLAAQGRVILTASRRASETVQAFSGGSSGVVRVGGVPFFMDAIISNMIGQFHRIEPAVIVEQSYGHTAELVAMLESEKIDLAIFPIADLELEAGYEFIQLLPGRNVVACGAGHPLLRKARLQAFDLARFPWVAPLPGSPLITDMQMILTSIGLSKLNVCYSGASLMSVIHFLTETDALAVLPFSCVHPQHRQNEIAVLQYEIPQPNRTLGIMRVTTRARLPAAERFVSYLARCFEKHRAIGNK